MTANGSVILLLAIVFTMANLPFVFDRILFVVRPGDGRTKGFGWRLVELVLLYLVSGGLAFWLESSAHGTVYEQGWAFYVTTFCMFVVFSFPGFTYRYLWHGRRGTTRVQT